MSGRKYLFVFALSFILLYGCCDLITFEESQPVNQPDDGNQQPPVNDGEDEDDGATEDDGTEDDGTEDDGTEDDGTEDDEEQLEQIPSGTIALFHISYLNSGESGTGTYDYYGNPVTVESSSKAVVMYLPELDQTIAIKTYTSYSYSENAVYPYTTGGRFFVVRDWGSDWSGSGDVYNNNWDIEEFDVYTGQLKSTTDINANQFAVVGDYVYFTSGGVLKAVEVGGNSYYATDLQYASGSIYGVGDHLISVAYDYSGEYVTFDIREHDLSTGEITSTLYSDVPTNPTTDKVYPGEEAIYQVQTDGNMKYIYRYPLVGEEESFGFELLEGESGIYIAEDDGILAILIQGSATEETTKITNILLHDLSTGDEGFLEIENPYSAAASYSRIGTPFLIVD